MSTELDEYIDARRSLLPVRVYRAIKRGIMYGVLSNGSVGFFLSELERPDGGELQYVRGFGPQAVAAARVLINAPVPEPDKIELPAPATIRVSERTIEIADRIRNGESQASVARAFGISAARAHQIAKRFGLNQGHLKRPAHDPKLCIVCGHPLGYYSDKYCSHRCQGKAMRKDHDGMRECTHCGEIKPTSEYYVTRKETGQLYSYCKQCHSKKMTRYTQNRIRSGDADFVRARTEATMRYAKKRYHSDPEYRKKILQKRADRYRRQKAAHADQP